MTYKPSMLKSAVRHLTNTLVGVGICTGLAGCYASFSQIDDRVSRLLDESSGEMNAVAAPVPESWAENTLSDGTLDAPDPPTYNPPAGDLMFESAANDDINSAIGRLNDLITKNGEGELLTLKDALLYSVQFSREYQYAMETFVIECLQLLIQRHLWGPQFFDTVRFDVNGAGSSGLYETSMDIVNDFGVSQRLPYGGEVSVQYLASFAKTLHDSVTDGSLDSLSSGTIVLGANIPLLRNAGPIAQENLIQAERDLTYAARDFEDFRRTFFFQVVRDYLDLLVARQTIANGETSVELYEKLSERQKALYEAGRVPLYAAAEAENNALQEQSRQANRWEQYRVNLDRFKVKLNWPVEKPVRIHNVAFAIDPPVVDMETAISDGLARRLDLQTLRDRMVDRERTLRNAKNQLLPDLNLSAGVTIPSREEEDGSSSFMPEIGDTDFNAGVTLGIPLDREIEKLTVREAQILLERNRLELSQALDTAAVEIRAAVRDIDASLFSLDIQKRNVEIAQLNIDAINANPDSVSVLNQLEAIRSLRSAEDGRAQAFRNLQISILQYLLGSGQLRVQPDGMMEQLPGMQMKPTEDLSYGDNPA